MALLYLDDYMEGRSFPGSFRTLVNFGSLFGTLVYFFCRLIFLAITLRRMPAGIFEITVWTKFIPHFS